MECKWRINILLLFSVALFTFSCKEWIFMAFWTNTLYRQRKGRAQVTVMWPSRDVVISSVKLTLQHRTPAWPWGGGAWRGGSAPTVLNDCFWLQLLLGSWHELLPADCIVNQMIEPSEVVCVGFMPLVWHSSPPPPSPAALEHRLVLHLGRHRAMTTTLLTPLCRSTRQPENWNIGTDTKQRKHTHTLHTKSPSPMVNWLWNKMENFSSVTVSLPFFSARRIRFSACQNSCCFFFVFFFFFFFFFHAKSRHWNSRNS